MPAHKKTLIQVSSVSQSFKVGTETIPVLHDISFKITPGSFNIIYGPSGSGKSTLLNILAGVQTPTQGGVTFKKQDIYTLKPDQLALFRAKQIGFVYQSNYWVQSLNAVENVAIPLLFSGLNMHEAIPIAMDALERVGVAQYAKKPPMVLSGGEQQRVAMARALVADPMLVIADEPTGNLDSKNGDAIINLLKTAQQKQNRTVILVTHNLEYVELADHLLRIKDGGVIDMEDESLTKATEELFHEMRSRINKLSKANEYGK